jgi:transcriptional regulator with PAS, ATPase and Fis domain
MIIITYLTVREKLDFFDSFIVYISILITLGMVIKLLSNKHNNFPQSSTSLFSNIMKNLNDPLLLLDNNSNVIMANISATSLFGRKIINQYLILLTNSTNLTLMVISNYLLVIAVQAWTKPLLTRTC